MASNKITNITKINLRADKLLADYYSEYSRAALAKLFDLGMVTKSEKAIKAGDKIKPSDSFWVDISLLQKPAKNIKLPILCEDENIIVIDKPVGVISHARSRYWNEASVASFVRSKVTDMDSERAGIVHRLDRATSGVMVCAKNVETLKFLQKQFFLHKTKKTYFAVVHGNIQPQEAIIDIPIGRNPKKPQTFKPDPNGKNSSTHYKVIKRCSLYSLLQLKPATGRTHQLRVHLQHLGHPIVGDVLYGGDNADRMYLHAYSLEINLPSGKKTTFVSRLPKNFKDLLK